MSKLSSNFCHLRRFVYFTNHRHHCQAWLHRHIVYTRLSFRLWEPPPCLVLSYSNLLYCNTIETAIAVFQMNQNEKINNRIRDEPHSVRYSTRPFTRSFIRRRRSSRQSTREYPTNLKKLYILNSTIVVYGTCAMTYRQPTSGSWTWDRSHCGCRKRITQLNFSPYRFYVYCPNPLGHSLCP